MSQHRRRAANFTDSINSFQQPENDSTAQYSMSEDSLNVLTSLGTQSAPDLNKRINVHDTAQLPTRRGVIYNPQFGRISNESNTSPSISGKGSSNTTTENRRRDANYNVNDKSTKISQSAKPKITSMWQLVSLLKCSNKEKSICDKNCKNDFDKQEAKRFESILHSLDNQLFETKKITQSPQILKRLSDKYMHSPEKFTEKLLSVIEESVIHDDDESAANSSAIDLSRLTTEFRKMCKFIEDETPPKWPLSPLSMSSCTPVLATPVCTKSNNSRLHKNENMCFPTGGSITSTPLRGSDIFRKRFFNKIAGTSCNGSIDNNSFETLEALCNKLYPNELRKSLSEPSLLDMSQIRNICVEQMAALDASVSHKENTQNVSSASLDASVSYKENTQDVSSASLDAPGSYKEHMQDVSSASSNKLELDCTKLKEIDDKSESTSCDNTSCSIRTYRKVDNGTNSYTILDPDEFEETLFQDIAEKRKRCLDTARLIAEINIDSEAIEAQRSSPTSLSEKNSVNLEETNFLRTLMSCKNYQTYLEERKPLFKLLHDSNPNTSENSIKETERCENGKDLKRTPGIGENEKQSQSIETQNGSKKPKYFHTPGKTPPNKELRQKKKYFNSPLKENVPEGHILKSPHAEGLYRLNYKTVLSPVAMYIRGTDTRLIQNVHSKKNCDLLTPLRNSKASPSGSSKLNILKRGTDKSKQETLPRFNLSPKIPSYNQQVLAEKTSGHESPSDHFMLPKVSYKRPLFVRTIKEGTTPKQGPRVKKLLEDVESKVVIRHEGRINSAQKGKSTPREINYSSKDESIHIETRANRNF